MRLIQEEKQYFIEVGEIVEIVRKLKEIGVDVAFGKNGMQVSTTYGDGFREEYFETASELVKYYDGLQDGYWHAQLVERALFTHRD